MSSIQGSESGATTTVEFDSGVYRLTAVKKAAYKFGGRFYVQIDTRGNQTIVTLTARIACFDVAQAVGEFRNEVLDQEMREVVAKETEGIRNLLLAQAFSSVSLVDEKGDDGDYHTDPLGISQSGKKARLDR